MNNLEKREVRSHNKVCALFVENKVYFARAEQLWSLAQLVGADGCLSLFIAADKYIHHTVWHVGVLKQTADVVKSVLLPVCRMCCTKRYCFASVCLSMQKSKNCWLEIDVTACECRLRRVL